MLLLYILWDDWLIFMISASNEQLQQELEYTLLKPGCHSWWISKMQSDTLEEQYAIKFRFKLGKNDATETYGMLQTTFGASCMSRAWVFEWHKRFKEGRESVRDDKMCGRSKEVNTPKLIGQSTRTIHQSTTPSLSQTISPRWASKQFLSLPIVQTWLPVTFAYSLSSEAVVMRELRRWKRLWQRSLTCWHIRTSIGPCRSCWNGPTSALQLKEITSEGCRVSCVYYQ